MTLVSIVTPSFNQAAFLEETIRSVLDQDYPNVEHIVVDGGSTDGTVAILERYSHLRWLSEPDDGQAEALNKGFRLSRGEVLGWLNSDDLYLPGAVSTAVEALARSGAGLAHGGWRRIAVDGTVLDEHAPLHFDYAEQLRLRNLIAQPAAFFTRAAFQASGGLDTSYDFALDYDLWLRLARFASVVEIDRQLAAFRVHDASKTALEYRRFVPEMHRSSRVNGGPLLTARYADYLCEEHPSLWRAREVCRICSRHGRRLGAAFRRKTGD